MMGTGPMWGITFLTLDPPLTQLKQLRKESLKKIQA